MTNGLTSTRPVPLGTGPQKGTHPLEVAVTRVIKGELHRLSGKTGITLLLDLKGFFENVSHTSLVGAALRHNYPPLLLHGAMQIYRGKRHLCAEGMLSAPVVATQGIVVGCPLAPGLSKLIMHEVVAPVWHGSPSCHVDLYIDDTGFDVVNQDPKVCAQKAYLVWQRVKRQLEQAKLPLSAGKSAWICSNPKAEKALNKLLRADDPQVKSLAKRRLTTLNPPKKAMLTARKQGVLGVALYGHVAVGLAPKRPQMGAASARVGAW